MATYMNIERVKYMCSCDKWTAFSLLYFCKHCLKLRCSKCVTHEVDNHYCPNCLENMPSTEAMLKKNRCSSCFDCPCCQHTLSTRATTLLVGATSPTSPDSSASQPSGAAEEAPPATPKKVYYLACGFCRWTSRDGGLQDQPVASGGWNEEENPHNQQISNLVEYYQQMALVEQVERDRKRTPSRRRALLQHADKYGLTSVVARHRAGLSPHSPSSLKKGEDAKLVELEASEASDDIALLSEDYYNKPVNLNEVCTIGQSISQPELQWDTTSKLKPHRKTLLVKRSKRCRECEHNLIKPDFSPSSIKFKIQLIAIYLVPEIRVVPGVQLHPKKESRVILTLSNPSQYEMHVIVLPSELPEDVGNCKVVLPKTELVLAAKDETAEFDDAGEPPRDYKDDPQVVVFRKANKLGFVVKITPNESAKEAWVSFMIKYDYRQVALEAEAPQPTWLHQHVACRIG
ncbi:PREDICTED: dynactin subunit 4-like [Priapulus caudatus]|uniref:Dynactin subunit 4 n=1 Tax=Priapulus caudatus TaxID=37621 RepID=A0ABM1FAU3_PRICU|nr:PREDICTED: dynactin subunit 4-like [Priapulus caudatus]